MKQTTKQNDIRDGYMQAAKQRSVSHIFTFNEHTALNDSNEGSRA